MALLITKDKTHCSKEQDELVKAIIDILDGRNVEVVVGSLLTALSDVINHVPPEMGEDIVMDTGQFAVQMSAKVIERRDRVEH